MDSQQENSNCEAQQLEPLDSQCNRFRDSIKCIGDSAKALMNHSDFGMPEDYLGQQGEMKANIMLAYRHLEDARMRIGKVLQAAGDGVSILDKQ